MATYDLAYPGAAIDAILNTSYFLQEAGYIFQGSASEYSGTPSKRVWLIAPAGFTGYGISSPVPQGSIGICLYNGTSWVGKIINVATIDSTPTQNSGNAVSSGGAYAAINQLSASVTEALENLTFTDNTPSAFQDEYINMKVSTTEGGVERILTYLTILAATTSKAGLLSAEDKVKIDSFLTNLRSLTFADTTASADQATQITETLKATIGGVQEVIDSITLLAATSYKAGLLSASDKAYIDALPATLTSLSNSISGALALMQSLVGYYVCDTAAGTAAKTVAATGYSLTNGGCIRIKMTNANTADNVTLNINSTGAKALYYDGEQASSTNTWEAGEVLEVYYDGTQYQCASGGGGKFATGEKVKEVSIIDEINNSDNLVSSKAIYEQKEIYDNVLSNCFHEADTTPKVVNITRYDLQNGNTTWGSNTARVILRKNSLISVLHISSITVVIPYSAISSSTIDRVQLEFYDENKQFISSLDKGWTYFNGANVSLTADLTSAGYENARYVAVYFGSNSAISVSTINTDNIQFILTPSQYYTTKAIDEELLQPLTDEVNKHTDILENCYHTTQPGEVKTIKITSHDIQSGTRDWGSNSARLTMKKDSLISLLNAASVVLYVPYSAVSSSTIDRCQITFYDADRNFLSALDLGWFYFNGADVTISVDLTDPTYSLARYCGIYFGSDSTISPSSVDTYDITYTITMLSEYITKAVDVDMFNPIAELANENSDLLSNCRHAKAGRTVTVGITNDELDNLDQSWKANTKRIALKKDDLIYVKGLYQVTLVIPYSAVSSDPNIDRCMINLFNGNKVYQSALTLGWFYFNGEDVTITVNLIDPIYYNTAYVGVYFGSNNKDISPSSVDTSNITFTLIDPDPYTTKAVDTELLKEVFQMDWNKQETTTDYYGDRISLATPYVVKRYSYEYEQIGTLASGIGTRQGGAVYGKFLFQFHVNLGSIVIFDLETKTNIQVINDMATTNNHANDGGFSHRFYDSSDPFPLLYISCGGESHAINVYRITGTYGNFAMTLIQTITYVSPYYHINALVDADANRLVFISYTQDSWSDSTNNECVIFTAPIPDINEDVTITEFGFMSRIPFIYAHQGGFVNHNILYICFGNTNSNAGVLGIEYITGRVINSIGVRAIGNFEPEALGEYNGTMIMTTQTGKVYQLTF